ncbi:MAG: dephospho-CoA kinase [SAR202 cluster bacterium]|nr:dephospho-CoA kinase [SAR202 cluster bacterium]
MFVIGLTGGIGTGKSVVAKMLRRLGAAVIDADEVGHEAYLPGTEGLREVVRAFGKGILGPDGAVDRKKLGALVFGEPEALKRLNAILRPRMYNMMKDRLAQFKERGSQVAVVDAAVLIEAGWDELADEVWVVTAPAEAVLERLKQRPNLDERAIQSRMQAQPTQEERIKHADVVIDNSGSLDALERLVRELWDSRVIKRQETRERK